MQGRAPAASAPGYGAVYWDGVSLWEKIHLLIWAACLDSDNGHAVRVPELGERIRRCAQQLFDNYFRHHVTLFPPEKEEQPKKKKRRRR